METEIAHLINQFKTFINRLPAQPGTATAGPTGGKRYYNDMVQYIQNAQIVSDCAEVSIYNQGTTTMTVNGVTFAPNTGIAFDGKEGETDTTKYDIRFSGVGQNLAFVVRKVYVS